MTISVHFLIEFLAETGTLHPAETGSEISVSVKVRPKPELNRIRSTIVTNRNVTHFPAVSIIKSQKTYFDYSPLTEKVLRSKILGLTSVWELDF